MKRKSLGDGRRGAMRWMISSGVPGGQPGAFLLLHKTKSAEVREEVVCALCVMHMLSRSRSPSLFLSP